jgi:hypothetical protein
VYIEDVQPFLQRQVTLDVLAVEALSFLFDVASDSDFALCSMACMAKLLLQNLCLVPRCILKHHLDLILSASPIGEVLLAHSFPN